MDHNARIEAAIADLESQDRQNIAATAKKWGVARETLSKRFRGKTVSNQEANSYARRQLTDTQCDGAEWHGGTLTRISQLEGRLTRSVVRSSHRHHASQSRIIRQTDRQTDRQTGRGRFHFNSILFRRLFRGSV
jgi:hypothetical protein